MRKLTLPLVLFCVAAVLAVSSAFAAGGQQLTGKISAVSDSQITVADGDATLTCAVPTVKNYSLSAHFHAGDAVRLECKQTDSGLVMSALHRIGGDQPQPPAPGGDHGTPTTPPPGGDHGGTPQPPTGDHGSGTTTPPPGGDHGGTPQPPAAHPNGISGKVAAVTDTTITVADGGRSLTCTAVGDLNPARVFHVGDSVILECKQTDAGTLVIAAVHRQGGDTTPPPPSTTPPSTPPPPSTTPPASGDHK